MVGIQSDGACFTQKEAKRDTAVAQGYSLGKLSQHANPSSHSRAFSRVRGSPHLRLCKAFENHLQIWALCYPSALGLQIIQYCTNISVDDCTHLCLGKSFIKRQDHESCILCHAKP